jgi:hypothetical protein
MEKTYVIAWKSRSGASHGQGKKLFTREEGERLVEELNQDHPNFIHCLNPGSTSAETESLADDHSIIGADAFVTASSQASDLPQMEPALV